MNFVMSYAAILAMHCSWTSTVQEDRLVSSRLYCPPPSSTTLAIRLTLTQPRRGYNEEREAKLRQLPLSPLPFLSCSLTSPHFTLLPVTLNGVSPSPCPSSPLAHHRNRNGSSGPFPPPPSPSISPHAILPIHSFGSSATSFPSPLPFLASDPRRHSPSHAVTSKPLQLNSRTLQASTELALVVVMYL